MSPVSLRAQPANAIRLAANSANFFIDFLVHFRGSPGTRELSEARLAYIPQSLVAALILHNAERMPVANYGPFGEKTSARGKPHWSGRR